MYLQAQAPSELYGLPARIAFPPIPHDLAVGDPGNRHRADLNFLASGWWTQERAFVRAAGCVAFNYLIALGDQIFSGFLSAREGFEVDTTRQLTTFQAGSS